MTPRLNKRVRNIRARLPIILGVLDTIAITAYILHAELLIFQFAVLGLKLLLLPVLLRQRSSAVAQLPLLFSFALCCILSLVFAMFPTPGAVLQIIGFLSNLTLTLLLLPEEVGPYLRTTSLMITIYNAIYCIAAAINRIPVVDGRHQYFNGAEPNLGAEIAAMGVVAGAMTLSLPRFMLVSIPALIVSLLTQGRAAILAIALTIMLKFYRSVFLGQRNSRLRLWVFASLPFVLVGTLASLPYLVTSLMLSDKDRGFGAGVSGRTELWLNALHFFQTRPLTGIGLGGYGALKLLPPHNFILYAMAEMGLLSFAVFAIIGYLAVRCYQQRGGPTVYLLMLLPLLMFNARLFNLNIYPFALFVALFALSAQEGPRRARAWWRPKLGAG
jgi:O-antigen ligase